MLSDHILTGVARARANPYNRVRYAKEQAEEAFEVLRRQATSVTPDPAVRGICNDEEVDMVLATGVAGRVSHLVTGDRGPLRIGSYQSIAIVTPHEFLARFPRRTGIH
jgi:predicted nucleic acid-binding protein